MESAIQYKLMSLLKKMESIKNEMIITHFYDPGNETAKPENIESLAYMQSDINNMITEDNQPRRIEDRFPHLQFEQREKHYKRPCQKTAAKAATMREEIKP